jgi:hypothetical protein
VALPAIGVGKAQDCDYGGVESVIDDARNHGPDCENGIESRNRYDFDAANLCGMENASETGDGVGNWENVNVVLHVCRLNVNDYVSHDFPRATCHYNLTGCNLLLTCRNYCSKSCCTFLVVANRTADNADNSSLKKLGIIYPF